MTARLDKTSAKKHDIKVKNSAAMKALTALEKKVAPMQNVMVKVAAHVAHFKHQIKPVTDTFKKIATKAWTITLKVKDGVSFVLTKTSTMPVSRLHTFSIYSCQQGMSTKLAGCFFM